MAVRHEYAEVDRDWHGPIRQDRIRQLLATRRPGTKHPDWMARLRALNFAKLHALPELVETLEAETAAMWGERDAMLDRERERRSGPDQRAIETADIRASLHCQMRDPTVRGMTGDETRKLRICFLDAKRLPARRQIWCSDECVQRWHENHSWAWARHAAVDRDKATCVRCGRERIRLIDQCGNCGIPWTDEMHLLDGGCPKGWSDRPIERRYHVRYTKWLELEVNHKDPREGRGYHEGCHHHQDRLETLCHDCHVIETTRQGRERRRRRAPDTLALPLEA